MDQELLNDSSVVNANANVNNQGSD
jgi:hypothetical protein